MSECPECYPNQPISWRDQPMNETIRERLDPQRFPNIYHHSLYDALSAWGQQIEENESEVD